MLTLNSKAPSEELRRLVVPTAHTLIAGTTGSGKSVLLNSLLYSLMVDTDPIFYLVDTKRVELRDYTVIPNRIHHVTEPEDVPDMLNEVIAIMEERYKTMVGRESTEPRLYIVIDELADLIDDPYCGSRVLPLLIKIGRLGRAAHVHMICCTQDPSRRTLSAQLMHNFTTCFALKCRDCIESRQIIGQDGAEALPKYGKAIVSNADGRRTISVPLTPDKDIKDMCESMAMVETCRRNEQDYLAGKTDVYPIEPAWMSTQLAVWLKFNAWEGKWVNK